jgi:hypothetical protein
VAGEVEDHDLAAGLEDAVNAADGLRGFFGVVQSLAEDGQVNAFRVNRRVLEIAKAEFEVLQVILLRSPAQRQVQPGAQKANSYQ